MKKLLSIIFAVLMVVTMIPFTPVAFAAGDGVPLNVDVPDEDIRVDLGGVGGNYDEDGYILTGGNENAAIYIYEGCNITLDDFTGHHLNDYVVDDTINITIEGDNVFTDNFSPFKGHIVLNAAEGATLKAAFASTGGNSGTFTVNGGDIAFVYEGDENYPSIACEDFIINGGTVTAENNKSYTVYGPVKLNGGTLNLISTSATAAAIYDTITMKKGALLTVSSATDILNDDGNISMADGLEEGNSFFVRYDTTSDFVPVSDIGAALEGENYAEVKVDSHSHSFVDSICNSCGLVCTHEAFADGECGVCGNTGKLVKITMSDSYGDGWNGNAVVLYKLNNGEYSELDAATFEDGNSHTYVTFLSEDDVFELIWKKGSYSNECSFTVAVNGENVAEVNGCDKLSHGEVIYSSCAHTYTDGNCDNCGAVCRHDTENGTCSICGKYVYAITHQPSVAEPYVELNNSTGAKYQWYEVEGVEEITDENASGDWSGFGAPEGICGTYDSATGWSSYGGYFFVRELKAGDKVTVTVSEKVDAAWIAYAQELVGDYDDSFDFVVNDIQFTFVAQEDGYYGFCAYNEEDDYAYLTARAYIGEPTYRKIEGETAAELKNPETGKEYACEVTFGDSETTEMSDMFSLAYVITHQPTAAEPYVELNDGRGVKYQWYEAEGIEEITDENASGDLSGLGAPEGICGTYDSATGWSSYGGCFFVRELKAGDKVTVTVSEKVDVAGIVYAQELVGKNDDYFEFGVNGTQFTFVAQEDGYYGFCAYNEEDYERYLTARAYIGEPTYRKTEGETAAELKNPEVGKRYVCEVTFGDGETTETSDVFRFDYVITHQPTSAEPYVELNDGRGVKYQWYEFKHVYTEVTDENAAACEGSISDASYSSENGWSPAVEDAYSDGSYSLYGFEIELKKGDTLILETTDEEADYGIYLQPATSNHVMGADPAEDGKYYYNCGFSGRYAVQYFDDNPDVFITATVVRYDEGTKLEGQTAAELKNPVFGKSYGCEVTFGDGKTTRKTDILEYDYTIIHQPTEEEFYIQTNDSKATYQWVKVIKGEEITDENAIPRDNYNDKYASYDEENGWTGTFTENYYNGYEVNFFGVELEAGQTITLRADGAANSIVVWSENNDEDWKEFFPDGTETVSFTASYDDVYNVYACLEEPVHLRAWFGEVTYTPVVGKTSTAFYPAEPGTYACKVAYSDGATSEVSSFVEATTVHTCDFSGGWKYDNQNHWKECVCGAKEGTVAHSWKAATCTAPKTCSVCGKTEGNANGHKFDNACDTTCNNCTYTRTISHTLTTLGAVAPTYTKTGLTEGQKCTVCGTVTAEQKIVDKLTLGKVGGLKVKAAKLAKGTKTTLTLAWTKVEGAEKYEIEQRVGKTWKYVGTTSKTSYTVKKLKANKSYKFRVRAVIDGVTPGAFSKTFTAKTVPLKTTLTLKAGKKQLTASWKTVANITGYEVQYSTSKKFTKKATKTVTIKKSKTKKTTIKKLTKGKKYYVRVRTYKTVNGKKIYSAWSSVKNVKVK